MQLLGDFLGDQSMKSVGLALIGALTLAGTAFAQVPNTNDTSSGDNTGMGSGALGTSGTNSGSGNTAAGFQVLTNNSGSFNTAIGNEALYWNTSGSENTACGASALQNNTTGSNNTASGIGALVGATEDKNPIGTGSYNTATGVNALYFFSTGSYNTASGYQALYKNASGNYNTASGYEAMLDNTLGVQNSAYGLYALHGNVKGDYNAALGGYALYANTSGSSNIALGYKAGFYPTAGANNIHIGNLGAAGDTGVIKIGTQNTQIATSIAGIYSTSPMTGGSVVVVNSEGLLGVQAVSSERFKSDIMPMNKNTTRLEQLRPVSFHYKSDPHGPVQYGLVAEEVARVYPELVTRDERGDVNGVRYDELAPMLLNEMKLQKTQIRQLEAALAAQARELQALQRIAAK